MWRSISSLDFMMVSTAPVTASVICSPPPPPKSKKQHNMQTRYARVRNPWRLLV